MKIKIMSIAIIVLLAIGSIGAVSLKSDEVNKKSDNYVSGEVIVGFSSEVDISEMQEGDKDPVLGCKIIRIIKTINTAIVEVREGKENTYIQLYEKSPLVNYAETNGMVHALGYPNDPAWSKQWGPKNIKCPEGWPGAGSTSTVIAIIDTGVDKNHDDLAARLTNNGYDFVNDDNDPDDDQGHGTHCAGIAAAITNNDEGIAGVAGEAPVQIMPIKVLGHTGSGSAGDVASGIDWAVSNGADVISMSLGSSSSTTSIRDACEAASNAGVVVIAAAGNDGVTSRHYPAGYDDWVIAVAATDSNNERASFSNWGDWVDIAAPGVNIYSCYDGNTYKSASGTSMACPHVAGVAALGKTRGWSRDKIWQELEACADDLAGSFVTWGKVDATFDGNEAPPDDFTVELKIHKITQKDDIDFDPPLGDGIPPELYYETTGVSSGRSQNRANYDYSSSQKGSMAQVGIKYFEDSWQHRSTWNLGMTHTYSIYGGDATLDITIKLMDSDWIWHDHADISSRTPDQEIGNDDGRTFRVTYDLVENEITSGDRSEPTGSSYFPRYTDGGKWDGTDGDEPIWDITQDDAYLEFTISDTYDLEADGGGPYTGKVNENIEFDGTAGGGKSPYTYYWTFGDGSHSSEKNPTHKYSSAKTYTASLKVTDNFGNSHTDDDIQVTVTENQAPNKPNKPSGPTAGSPDTSYEYSFKATDPDGDQVSYYIDWGDGTNRFITICSVPFPTICISWEIT